MNEFSKYETALASLRCYARMHNYEFRIAVSAHFLQCFTRDFMFARHCIVAEHLYIADYTLFLDADMAVVSPKRKIEEWIDPRFDLTLYERFINFEIAAGSYIAKNTKWTFDFLKKFAKYGDELEEKVVGSDNAALHMFLADELYPEMRDEFEPCRKAQQKVKWGIDLYVYEVCVRMTIGNQLYMKNVRMLRKGTGWVRDVWLADSRWSPDRDFILHGLQEARVENFTGQFVERAKLPWMRKAFYYKLFNKIPDIHKCYDPDYDFDLDERFIKSKAEVDEILREIKADVDESKWNFAGMLPNFIDF
ncbi:unnamed protein product, partial [Mesorhabditis belari]|uniref:Uncharacterized protein n=1 Tax=Mesorhabditis belari TaxID=2138241 RepID=A0AAF3EPJ2_9BILA